MGNHKKYIKEFFGRDEEQEAWEKKVGVDQESQRSMRSVKMRKQEEVFEKHGDLDKITDYIGLRQDILDKNGVSDIKGLSKVNWDSFTNLESALERYMSNIDFVGKERLQDRIDSTDMDAVLDDLTKKRLEK